MKEGLVFFTDTHLTVIGLILFFVLFLVLTVMHSWLYDSEKLKEISQLPLLEESENE